MVLRTVWAACSVICCKELVLMTTFGYQLRPFNRDQRKLTIDKNILVFQILYSPGMQWSPCSRQNLSKAFTYEPDVSSEANGKITLIRTSGVLLTQRRLNTSLTFRCGAHHSQLFLSEQPLQVPQLQIQSITLTLQVHTANSSAAHSSTATTSATPTHQPLQVQRNITRYANACCAVRTKGPLWRP